MRDDDCVALLRWALPRLQLNWAGFRKVHGQVCKRLRGRLRELGLADFTAYRTHLESDPGEWERLDHCCRITISRFYRDRPVFDAIAARVLPDLAARAEREKRSLRAWSVGCASGEEPYSLKILWDLEVAPRFPGVALSIVATDVDAEVLRRAREGRYPAGSLRELPARLRDRSLEAVDGDFRVRPQHREGVVFLHQDLRRTLPDGCFDLVLCRNLAFTYFAPPLRRTALARLLGRLRPLGYLVIGSGERLPPEAPGLVPLAGREEVFQLVGAADAPPDAAMHS